MDDLSAMRRGLLRCATIARYALRYGYVTLADMDGAWRVNFRDYDQLLRLLKRIDPAYLRNP